jgi:hypothetical protein
VRHDAIGDRQGRRTEGNGVERGVFPNSVIWNVARNLSLSGGWPPAASSVARFVQSRARSVRSRHAANGVKSSGSVSGCCRATNQLTVRQPRNAPSQKPTSEADSSSRRRVGNAEREVEPDDAHGPR